MITSKGTAFFASGSAQYSLELQRLGWRYLKTTDTWMATDITKVIPVITHCDPKTALVVEQWLTRRKDAVAASAAASAVIDVPSPTGFNYRGYQKAGIAFMRARKYSLNADAPRLGKTIQVLGLVNSYNRPLRVLVISPSNAKINWCNEAEKWLVHKTSIGYCEGSHCPDTDFMSINYEILGRHLNFIGSRHWDIVVADEAHVLGNPTSQRTKNVFSLDGRLHFVCLTGTPFLTRTIQLFPMLEKLDRQGLGANFWRFTKRYCGAHINDEGRWDHSGASNTEELQFRMRETVMVRREKYDVAAELPTARQTVLLPKTGLDRLIRKERSLVSQNLDHLMDRLKGEMTETDWVELSKFDSRNENGELFEARRDLALAKVPMVVEFIEDILKTERKVVVFAHHRDAVLALSGALKPYGVATIIGGLTATKREAERIRFQEDPDCRVIVGNITAMGSAIELSAADTTVFAELSWMPAEIDQAEERIWLPTKEIPLTIYRLVVEDSVEHTMAIIMEGRQDSMDRMRTLKYVPHLAL